MRSVLACFLVMLICLTAQPSFADRRVALVVGMSQYLQVPRLTNPTRDADAVSALFRRAGFDVVASERDLGITDFRRVVRQFSETARDADIAVVYYAGHGIEVDGINYLIPTDARLQTEFDIEDETISLERVMKSVDSARRLKLIILDACRDNPFAASMKRSVASRSIGRGLSKIEPTMSDTLIAFAAKAGAVASDGDGENSPFATAVVKYVAEPGLDVRLAFGRIRDEVLKTTSNRQEPFVYGSLGGETTALVPAAVKPPDPEAQARIDYELAAQVGTMDAWDMFVATHSTGFYASLARAQKDKLAAAERTSTEADGMRREAEAQAAQKAAELRRQLQEQSSRQTAELKQKLSEQAKKDLEDARRQLSTQAENELGEARRQVESAQQQADVAQQQVEETRRQAIADAQRQVEQARRAAAEEAAKLAALTPQQTVQPVPSPPIKMDQADITRLLQAHLKRVGCNSADATGKWDEGSSRALGLFNKNARTTFDVKLASLDALDAVRSKTTRVCPLICGSGQRAAGDRCVQISCDSGRFLTSSGACEKRPQATPKAQAATRPEPVPPRPAVSAPEATHRSPAAGGKCFSFNGSSYCE